MPRNMFPMLCVVLCNLNKINSRLWISNRGDNMPSFNRNGTKGLTEAGHGDSLPSFQHSEGSQG